jgi:triosephosphate isomerase
VKFPILIINMKVYPEVLGRKALELAKTAENVSRELGVSIAVAPPMTELRLVAENVGIPVLAQGGDAVEPGARTGHVPLEFIKETGAAGVILNHSENRLLLNDLTWLVNKAKTLGLETVVCAPDPYSSAAAAALQPTAVAVEPPELIGTGKAVSREKPDVIIKTVELVRSVSKDVAVITGAGIESGEDVRKAIELGTVGVLVASAIVKAKDWREKIMEMAKALT